MRGDATRVLVAVVCVDVVLASVLRVERSSYLLSGRHDWQGWLSVVAMAWLLVVLTALVRVVRRDAHLMEAIARRDEQIADRDDASNEWVWETDGQLTLTYSSRQLAELLGYTPREAIGHDACDFMTLSTAVRTRDALLTGAAELGWRDLEDDWLHADGRVIRLRHSGKPIRDRDGTLLGYRGVCARADRDGAEARRLEDVRSRVQLLLDEGDLRIALQPIVDVRTGRAAGAEALARFPDERAPDRWFDEAGEAGLRFELEVLAVRAAIERLPELPSTASLSVNACPEVVSDPRFGALLLDAGVPLRRLVLEITEHVRVAQYEPLLAALAPLRAAGLRIAVDDTGAGYASLTHVLRLRPDVIKLDRSLVTGITTDAARRALVMSLALLAMEVGATLTAEGIETEDELAAVADLGVDHVQGYLIGRPTVDGVVWPTGLTSLSRS